MSDEKKRRGRPPKANKEQIDTINNALKEFDISENIDEFVKDFLTDKGRKMFSNNLLREMINWNDIATVAGSKGTYQPILSQNLLQQISFRPLPCTSEQLETWLQNPAAFAKNIESVSYWLSNAVGQYRHLLWQSSTSKAFHMDLVPLTKDTKVLKLLKKLNYKYQLAKVDLDLMYNGTNFWWFEETDNSFSLLQLPRDWCYLTSPWDYGFLFAFDLTYFDRFVGLQEAIPDLNEAYIKLVEARRAGLKGEELASMQYYPVSPYQGWCFSYDSVHPDRVSPFAASMGSSLDILSYKNLLKNNIILSLFRILSMKIPINKENSKPAINYKEASEITQVIQGSLPNGVISFSSPFEVEAVNVDQVNRLEGVVDLGNNNFAASSGLPDAFFGGSAVRQGTALTMLQQISFFKNSYHTYRQYENFINWLIMWKTTSSSRVKFHGNNLTDDADAKAYAELVRTANLPAGRLLSFYYEPYEYLDVLEKEDELGLKELMKPLVSGFNSKNGAGGRPTQQTVQDSGENTRDYQSNMNE